MVSDILHQSLSFRFVLFQHSFCYLIIIMVIGFDWLLLLCILGHMNFFIAWVWIWMFGKFSNSGFLVLWDFCLLFHYVLYDFHVLGLGFLDFFGFGLRTWLTLHSLHFNLIRPHTIVKPVGTSLLGNSYSWAELGGW